MSRSYKGIWTELNNYVANDVVLHEYNYYIALADNLNDAPPSDNWQIITVIDVIAYIIETAMNLSGRVVLYNQNYDLPKDKNLFCVIQYINSESYSNTSKRTYLENSVKESLRLLTIENIRINFLSRNDEARIRKNEFLSILSSTFTEQQEEIYNIRIAKSALNFVDVSEVEGDGMLNRFAIDIKINSWSAKDYDIDYFDNFSNNTIND